MRDVMEDGQARTGTRRTRQGMQGVRQNYPDPLHVLRACMNPVRARAASMHASACCMPHGAMHAVVTFVPGMRSAPGACVEVGKPKVHRVRSVLHSGFQLRPAAAWGEHFGLHVAQGRACMRGRR